MDSELFKIYGEHRELWDIHAGFYRDLDPNFSKTWEPSPAVMNTPLPLRSPLRPVFELPRQKARSGSSSNSIPSSQTVTIDIPTRKLSIFGRIRRFIKSGNFSALETVKFDIPLCNPSSSTESALENDKVKLHEWKAYGYWARPRVNFTEVRNSPVTSEHSIATADLEEIAVTLRDETGRHPENWVPGLKHRALPPRPTRWKIPSPRDPLPFPWEVQLNPLLQHHLWGPSALSWCVYVDPRDQSYHGRAVYNVPTSRADLSQPATYPFLTHMFFNAVAGDPAPRFPWPFTVVNETGIKVEDVLVEVWKTFREPIIDDELASWPDLRRSMAKWSLEKRLQVLSVPTPNNPFVDVLRRCDSYGAIMFFRGIEPTVDGGGWMVNFGCQ